MTARDIMKDAFHSLRPDTPIAEALRLFGTASSREGRRVFGMMVIDESGRLVGILSMYDLLTLLQPKHIHVWGEMSDIDLSGLIETMIRRTRELVVGDIMSTEVITVSGDTHLFGVLELMNRHHIRRLPVVDDGRVAGIVYLSDLFYHLAGLVDGPQG